MRCYTNFCELHRLSVNYISGRSFSNKHAGAVSLGVLTLRMPGRERERETAVLGQSRIVRTNGLPIERADGADVVGLYSTMSRFNHSCIHNVPGLQHS